MVDSTQVLIALVIVTLTVLLSVISVQVYFILREFQKTIKKVNKVLDDTGQISESVSKPITTVSAMLMGIKGGSAIMKALTKGKENKEKSM